MSETTYLSGCKPASEQAIVVADIKSNILGAFPLKMLLWPNNHKYVMQATETSRSRIARLLVVIDLSPNLNLDHTKDNS